jgi:hypothetical protein
LLIIVDKVPISTPRLVLPTPLPAVATSAI